jgi:hypothetical protein
MSSRSRVNQSTFLPIPARGVDFRVPIVNMPSEYSPWMFNFRISSGVAKVRPPHTQEIIGVDGSDWCGVIVSGSKVIAVQAGANGTVDNSSVPVTNNTPADVIPESFDYTEFRDRIFVGANGDTYEVDKTTLAWTSRFTHVDTATLERRPVTSYRERLYMAAGKILHYGGIGAITGAWTTVGFTNLINGEICALSPFSISAAFSPQTLFVVATTAGEILLFSGAYPGDPDWALVNRIKIEVENDLRKGPIQLVSIPNDVLVNVRTSAFVYSLRELVSTGIASGEAALGAQAYQLLQDGFNVGTDGQSSFKKSVAFLLLENSLVVRYDFREVPGVIDAFITSGDWPSISQDGFTYATMISTYDFSDGTFILHTAPVLALGEARGVDTRFQDLNDIKANPTHVFSPAPNGAARLFYSLSTAGYLQDSDFRTTTPGDSEVVAVISFPALGLAQGAGYKNKKFQYVASYTKYFVTSSLDHLTTYFQASSNFTQGETTFQSQQAVIAGSGAGIYRDILPITQLSNTSIITLRVECGIDQIEVDEGRIFYGIDLIFEDGGDF